MPSETLPRPSRDPEYLLRLRDKALARMAQDEALVSPQRVTRRWFALAAGAAIAAPRAFAGTLRNAAPQYGAPGLYAGGSRPPLLSTPLTRADLALTEHWSSTRITFIPNGATFGGIWAYEGADARTANYTLPSGKSIALCILADPKPGFTYIAPANLPFYVSTDTDLFGARFGNAELILSPAVFKYRTPTDGDAGVLARFAASANDSTLTRAAVPEWEIHILLNKGPKPDEWKDSSMEIMQAGISDGLLQLSGYGPGNHSGTFWIDLKSKQFIKFEGK